MQQSTLNQVKDRLQVLVLDNPLIRTFEWEQLSETNTEADFPLAHVFVGEGVNQVGSVLNLPINIMLMDLVQKDSSNKFEVSSDMLQVAKNILAALRLENDYFILDKDTISLADFYTEKMDTEACGWTLSFSLKIASPYDSCGMPYTPVGVSPIPVRNSDSSFESTATPPEYVIPDTPVLVRNTLNDVVASGDVPSSVEYDSFQAPDATIDLLREGETDPYRQITGVSGATTQETITDSTAVLKDSDGLTISSTPIPSESSVDITAPDGVAQLKDSAGGAISSTNIKSNETKIITAPNSTVNLNGSAFITPKSNETVNVLLTDQSTQTVVPTSTAGGNIVINNYDEVDNYLASIGSSNLSWRTYLRTFKQTLVDGGVWRKGILVNPVMGGTAVAHKKPLIGRVELSLFGGITHSSTGMKGNGTSGYYDANLAAYLISQNDFSVFIYCRDNQQDANVIGVLDSSNIGVSMAPRNTSDLFGSRGYDITLNTAANTDSRGVFGISRVSSTQYFKQLRNTQTTISATSAPISPSTLKLFGMVANIAGTLGTFTSNEQCFIWVGRGLTLAEMTTLTNAINALQTSLGRNVV